SRNYKSPLDLLTEKAPSLNPRTLCLPVLDLDAALSSQPVHHVPSLAGGTQGGGTHLKGSL
ncbi:MAG: hypothetical protein NTZ78_14535, partial [Candidatus Aureabacteria bacterium]|nr:hypothetical protein [Candidatus Auribacterota bacterium]